MAVVVEVLAHWQDATGLAARSASTTAANNYGEWLVGAGSRCRAARLRRLTTGVWYLTTGGRWQAAGFWCCGRCRYYYWAASGRRWATCDWRRAARGRRWAARGRRRAATRDNHWTAGGGRWWATGGPCGSGRWRWALLELWSR